MPGHSPSKRDGQATTKHFPKDQLIRQIDPAFELGENTPHAIFSTTHLINQGTGKLPTCLRRIGKRANPRVLNQFLDNNFPVSAHLLQQESTAGTGSKTAAVGTVFAVCCELKQELINHFYCYFQIFFKINTVVTCFQNDRRTPYLDESKI